MIGIGVGVSGVKGAVVGFNADDSSGTLLLDFVNPPPITLGLNFTVPHYTIWQDDAAQPGLVGYYQVKG